jgi:hypothetical protein
LRDRARSRCRLAQILSTAAWPSAATCLWAFDRSAAIATDRASFGSFFGGFAGEITAGLAARVLDQVTPAGAAAAARHDLAAEFLADLRRLDAQRRECAKKLATAVRACGTSLTGLFGVGPVIAGLVIGDVPDVTRFPSRSHFAAYSGTAPAGVSSGGRKVYRLSLRGNRRLNHAIHMAAITQIRHKHSDGRAYYDRKIAEGKTHKEALRSLKRRIRDAIYARLRADARQATAAASKDREGNRGTTLTPARPTPTPSTGSSDKPLPGLTSDYVPRQRSRRPCRRPSRRRRKPSEPLDNDENKEDSICTVGGLSAIASWGAPDRACLRGWQPVRVAAAVAGSRPPFARCCG